MNNVELLLGRLIQPSFLTVEDLHGALREAILQWQKSSTVARQPSLHPCPSCPECRGGVPYQLGERWLCDTCFCPVAEAHLWVWPMDTEKFLQDIAAQLQLHGQVHCIEHSLWQLGTGTNEGRTVACFACLEPNSLSKAEMQKLRTYRSVLVLHIPSSCERPTYGQWVPLAELFGPDGSFLPKSVSTLLRVRGEVQFNEQDGSLRIGGSWLGELVADSKEWHLVSVLAKHLNEVVSYTALKRAILERTGSSDMTEDATFCQKLKNNIKRKWIPGIDRLIVTTNKGEGYRLQAYVEL